MNDPSPYEVIGPITKPEKFFGRTAILDDVRTKLRGEQLRCAHVWGIRRSGKTSLLRHIVDPSEPVTSELEQGKRPMLVYHDCADPVARDPSAFFARLAGSISAAAGRLLPAPPECPDGFPEFREWMENALKEVRMVIALDEFHSLVDSAAFDTVFFGNLRTIADTHSDRFAWITASHISRPRLAVLIDKWRNWRNQPYSQLYNLFHWDIVMGPFSEEEAREAILRPTEATSTRFDEQEVQDILRLAGRLPFFVNCVADKWYEIKSQTPPMELAQTVLDHLADEDSGLLKGRVESIFRSLTREQQNAVKYRAGLMTCDATPDRCDTGSERECISLGLLEDVNGETQVCGLVLQRIASAVLRPTGKLKAFLCHSNHNDVWMHVLNYLKTEDVEVDHFNASPPYGMTAIANLEEKAADANLAIIVATKDDRMVDPNGDDKFFPRQNVVHEAGYFQGKLGLKKTLILLENGVEICSNLQGVQYIEFASGRVSDVFPELSKVLSEAV